ncbi:MAG: hypothetical protein EXS36_00825 [Pedosphaera sp.]|nr:hypothetical protein [Pedosphaera sp.]
MTFGSIRAESTDLVEVAPPEDPLQTWLNRNFTVTDHGAQIRVSFREGLPLFQGLPPFIFKTYILAEWSSPSTAGGGTLPTFSTDSFFARTVLPGHHNFFHNFLFEPAVDPALSESTRSALKAANIRYLFAFHASAFGDDGPPDIIRTIGADNSIRTTQALSPQ